MNTASSGSALSRIPNFFIAG
ncbi:hypothetical protein MED222_06065 [Vibrio sp. MED222]|nr:hypothetical protein MED222_06065 [Vibrio sp. MED222]